MTFSGLLRNTFVRQVLTRLLENRLFVKAEKCDFHVDTVSFLGYIIQCVSGSVKPDPNKVKAVEKLPAPKSRKELHRFLGFARFIRDYSKVASPLTRLTSINVRFCWSPEAHNAFCKLKQPIHPFWCSLTPVSSSSSR